MAVMNDVQQSTEPKSPTTLVMEYLRSKGVQPGSANYSQAVRTALHQNALDGGTLIPGLRNEDPGEDPNTKGATGGPGVGKGGGSSVASKVESSRGPNYGANAGDRRVDTTAPRGGATPPMDNRSSAPPEYQNPELLGVSLGDPTLPDALKVLGLGGAGIGAAILGRPQPTVTPPIQALPPTAMSPSTPPPPQFGPPVPPDMIAPSAMGPEVLPPRPDVPFNSQGPRVPPTQPITRVTPPGINLQPVPGTAAPDAGVQEKIIQILRGAAGAGRRFRVP